MDPAGIQSLLSMGPTGIAALLIAALIWLYLSNQRLRDQQQVAIQAQQDKVVAILQQTIPLTIEIPKAIDKLHDAIERLERATTVCQISKDKN
jgi:type VI protein secretion system component VasK